MRIVMGYERMFWDSCIPCCIGGLLPMPPPEVAKKRVEFVDGVRKTHAEDKLNHEERAAA